MIASYSCTKHFLLSAYGVEWSKVNLAMFTVYVDDSGSAKDQKVAIAAALIVPAIQIVRLESTWRGFCSNFGISHFHSSECAAKNPKSEFAKWDNEKVEKAFRRARQIVMKKATAAFVFAVDKDDFDSVAPKEWRDTGGQNQYTWGFRTLLHHLIRWHEERRIQNPFEFVFDWAEGDDRVEIEMLMDQFDSLLPGKFNSHYSFRRKKSVLCLQCADILAWSCYSMARYALKNSIPSRIAEDNWLAFRKHRDGTWLHFLTFDKKSLRDTIANDMADKDAMKERADWFANWKAKLKTRPAPQRSCC